jgi:hypothetical protein
VAATLRERPTLEKGEDPADAEGAAMIEVALRPS